MTKKNRNLKTLRYLCGFAILGSAVAGLLFSGTPMLRDAAHNLGALVGALVGLLYFWRFPLEAENA